MHSSVAEDEFDLLSAWAAIVRWRYLVGCLFLLGLLGGVLVGLNTQQVYESRGVLQIGRVGGIGRLQAPAELKEQVMLEHSVAGRAMRMSLPRLVGIEEIAEGTLLVSARGRSPEEARAFLAAELDKLIREHTQLFEEASLRKTHARETLVARIATSERQGRALGQQAEAIAPRNPTLGAVLTQDQIRLSSQLSELEQKLYALELELLRMSTWPTRLLREASVPAAPEGRGRLFLAIAGGGAGLLVGVFAALAVAALPRRNATARREQP
jgi:hypothetical protein